MISRLFFIQFGHWLQSLSTGGRKSAESTLEQAKGRRGRQPDAKKDLIIFGGALLLLISLMCFVKLEGFLHNRKSVMS